MFGFSAKRVIEYLDFDAKYPTNLEQIVKYGSGAFAVHFYVRYYKTIKYVSVHAKSRKELALVLLRFRLARRWVRSNPSITLVDKGIIKAYSLRWLARHKCMLSIWAGRDCRMFGLKPAQD